MSIAGRALTATQAGATYNATAPVTTLVSGIPFGDGAGVDRAGNVYFAIANQSVIKKWTATNNTVTTLVSSGITYPTWVAVDSADNVYFNGGGIQQWSAVTHAVTSLIASGPNQFALDLAGNIYFSSGNSVQVWTAANHVVATVTSSLNGPDHVAVDVAGNIYIQGGDGIVEWRAADNTVAYLFSPGFDRISGLAVDGEGNVYIAGQNSYYTQKGVLKWTVANNTLAQLVSSGSGDFFGVAVDGPGNLYFIDAYNGLLREIPNAFVDASPKSEGIPAGNDALPTVLPATLNLLAPFAPSSDATWLTITGVTNGVVSYSFTTNFTLTRTGHINLLGQSVSVTQLGPTFTLGTTNLYEGPASGSDSVVLAITPNFGIWTATTNVPWLHLSPANQSGIGSTNVIFNFDANPGATRSGMITITGQKLFITQAGSNYVKSGLLTALVSSRLSEPFGVAVDVAGNVYIADTTNNVVEKWTATNNTLTTLVSSGLNHPAGVAVAVVGNVYIADTGNGAIKQWNAAGNVSIGLSNPNGVAVDFSGNVYIADTSHNSIKEWMPASNSVFTLVSSGLSGPVDVAVDGTGNVYIADSQNNSIKEWGVANSNLISLISSTLLSPRGVAVDGAGNVYCADTSHNLIKEWALGNYVTTLVASGLSNPYGVAVDAAGNVYIADTAHNAIKEWMPANNNVATLVSSGLSNPHGVAVDGSGNVYIVDTAHNAIKKWTSANNLVSTILSSGLSSPNDVAVDTAGNVYIADIGNNAVKEIQYAFVDPTAKLEGMAAGNDALPIVLPAGANLLIPFTPSSDQPWLTIAGINNGVVSFAFTTNMGSARTAHINMLGQSISIIQGLIGTPPQLTGAQLLGSGVIQISFTNNPSASFTVLSTTNLSLPLANWTVVGSATNVSSGLFQFTSQPTTNDQQRYYIVHSP